MNRRTFSKVIFSAVAALGLPIKWAAAMAGPSNAHELVTLGGVPGYYDYADLGIAEGSRNMLQTITFFPCKKGLIEPDTGRAKPDGIMFARNIHTPITSWDGVPKMTTGEMLAKDLAQGNKKLARDIEDYYRLGLPTDCDPYGDGSDIMDIEDKVASWRKWKKDHTVSMDSAHDPFDDEGIATDTTR